MLLIIPRRPASIPTYMRRGKLHTQENANFMRIRDLDYIYLHLQQRAVVCILRNIAR